MIQKYEPPVTEPNIDEINDRCLKLKGELDSFLDIIVEKSVYFSQELQLLNDDKKSTIIRYRDSIVNMQAILDDFEYWIRMEEIIDNVLNIVASEDGENFNIADLSMELPLDIDND